jgi:hypothetical protein
MIRRRTVDSEARMEIELLPRSYAPEGGIIQNFRWPRVPRIVRRVFREDRARVAQVAL